METLCTYVVTGDTGLAPNPFWGWCTLAVCTPNHQGTRLKEGDWISGFLTKTRGHKFLYAMEVAEVLDLHDYFHDPRFAQKRPNLKGGWKERCGDNFYSRDKNGEWMQHPNRFHVGEGIKQQDTKYARVFIASRFWYLGRSAVNAPAESAPLAGGRGARVNHNPAMVQRFCKWVESNFKVGVADTPNDCEASCATTPSTASSKVGCTTVRRPKSC